MKKILLHLLPIADFVLWPVVYPAAWVMKNIRKAGVHRLPRCKQALISVGVFPIRNHYYEPCFDNGGLTCDFFRDRNLHGINWNISGQLELLETLRFADELADLPDSVPKTRAFYFTNGAFEAGDAEYWYQIVRTIKPKRIFEVGSGMSTLIAIRAIAKNQEEDPNYHPEHVCIEPYEKPWLEEIGVSVIRRKVEDVELSFFAQLEENDILFIDSSHVIRPHGDVLFEYLELLPALNKGVIVHVHDIFSPKNYPQKWLQDEVRLWNEQYLLEAFLWHNASWKVIGALNYLHNNHYDKLKAVAPFLSPERQPGSFYIQKVGKRDTTPT